MKLTKTKLAATSFGAAMTSLYSAPELNAQLVDLSFSPNTVPFVNLDAEANFPAPQVNFAATGFSNLNVGVYNNLYSYGAPLGLRFFSDFSNVGTLNTTGGVLDVGDVFDGK